MIIEILFVSLGLSAAIFTDHRFGKIPNWLTVPLFGLGIAYRAASGNLLGGLHGFLWGFLPSFVLFLLSWKGAGDVKLLGALGVWLGPERARLVVFGELLLASLLALVIYAYRKGSIKMLGRRLIREIVQLLSGHLPVEEPVSFPAAALIALTVAIVYIVTW